MASSVRAIIEDIADGPVALSIRRRHPRTQPRASWDERDMSARQTREAGRTDVRYDWRARRGHHQAGKLSRPQVGRLHSSLSGAPFQTNPSKGQS